MSFQAYIDTIYVKTGKKPEDFLTLARQKGLLEPGVKTGQIVDWLKQDFDLGRGHAMALIVTFNAATKPRLSHEEQIKAHFKGKKAKWQQPFDDLMVALHSCGPGIEAWPVNAYINLVREGQKFAIIQVTEARLDIGIKRKGVQPTKRFVAAGAWNLMVTHRVSITDPSQIDDEVLSWLQQAYEKASRTISK